MRSTLYWQKKKMFLRQIKTNLYLKKKIKYRIKQI